MPDKFTIRNLRKSDSRGIMGLIRRLEPETFSLWNRFGFSPAEVSPGKTARKICNAVLSCERGFVCLNRHKEIVAYSYLRFFPEKKTKKHVASLGIVVRQDYRSRGIGEGMMRYMHRWAEKNNLKKIWLVTYLRNREAIRLYKKLGYQVEGIFMYDEYADKGWDHVVSMALMLDKRFKDASSKRRDLIRKIEREF